MKLKTKQKLVAIIAVVLTFFITTLIVSIIILRGDQILVNFSIIDIENVSTNFEIKHQRVRAATHFDIVLYDAHDIQIYATTVYGTTNQVDFPMLQYGWEYTIMIYAFDRLGNQRGVNNPYRFRYTEPTFCHDNSLILTDNEDYVLVINGDLTKREYKIKITSNDNVILETELTDNEFTIEHQLFSESEATFLVQIIDRETSINEIILYNNINPISEIEITTPTRGATLDFNDVTFIFEGGEKATDYSVRVYDGRRVVRDTDIRLNRVVFSHEIFAMDREYRIVLTASYRDYEEFTRTVEVTFRMNDRLTLMPAYINVHHRYIRPGTKIELNHPNENGNIFFTLDGSDPTIYGKRYEAPFEVTENVRLRTVVTEPLYNNSAIQDFEITIGNKRQWTVYLSPSNQSRNFGVQASGFSNEMRETNLIADYMEARLRANGVRVLRNNPRTNIITWTAESNAARADLHFAIHTNGSPTGQVFGVENWIHQPTSRTYSLASHIQNALMAIYWSDDEVANRGVRFAHGAFGEVNDNFLPFGILVEIAFHDHPQDAAWVVQNREKIANVMTDAILRYFGII